MSSLWCCSFVTVMKDERVTAFHLKLTNAKLIHLKHATAPPTVYTQHQRRRHDKRWPPFVPAFSGINATRSQRWRRRWRFLIAASTAGFNLRPAASLENADLPDCRHFCLNEIRCGFKVFRPHGAPYWTKHLTLHSPKATRHKHSDRRSALRALSSCQV